MVYVARSGCLPQRTLQLLAGDTVRIVRWRREGDGKVAEGDVEELLWVQVAIKSVNVPEISG